ncbi:amidohydrolase [Jonesiaceae bacterium BS-20]|uniref:Amidohydrolase n=1 Tax=Jonesiaceae bacterium BS-20 TaxID=3120821 RepID=A0AAU7DXX8_9MICO
MPILQSQTSVSQLQETLTLQIAQSADALTALRRELHQHAELALQEFQTALIIERELDALGIPHVRVGETGVLGTITGKIPSDRVIALRADIDGLPVQEIGDVPYRSLTDGVMHACGHDSHVASLLGAARALTQNVDQLHGEVRLIFQPAEETGFGAKDFITAGALKGAQRVFGLHAAADLPIGTISVTPNINMAAVDHVQVEVQGKGAHVSRPHQGSDALYIASHIVVGLQALVARRTSPVEPVILGIGKLHSGTAYNSVAETAVLEGTTRTVSHESRAQARADIDRLANNVAQTYGGSVKVTWRDVTPPVINPPEVTNEVLAIAASLGSHITVINNRGLSLGGDNFAEFQLELPGVYAFVGTRNPAIPNSTSSHHNGRFDIDEAALPIAALLYASYALWWVNGGGASEASGSTS